MLLHLAKELTVLKCKACHCSMELNWEENPYKGTPFQGPPRCHAVVQQALPGASAVGMESALVTNSFLDVASWVSQSKHYGFSCTMHVIL